MEELLEILNEIDDSIDYENETALIDDQLLDSFAIITLVSELEDAFDISIEASEMMPSAIPFPIINTFICHLLFPKNLTCSYNLIRAATVRTINNPQMIHVT